MDNEKCIIIMGGGDPVFLAAYEFTADSLPLLYLPRRGMQLRFLLRIKGLFSLSIHHCRKAQRTCAHARPGRIDRWMQRKKYRV